MVCKDMGATNMVARTADILSGGRHEVFPVLEGMGASRWPEMCSVLPIFRGTDDYDAMPFSLEVEAVLERYHPDVVIVGTSFPNHLEQEFARAAQERGIPLVVVEDFWGGSRRISGLRRPDLVLTLDEYSARLVREQFGSESRVVVVGNPGVKLDVARAPEVMELRSGGDLVITLCGGGYETAEQIQLLLECLAVTNQQYKLIPRWHPKVVDQPDPENDNRPYRETWDALLAPLGDRVVRVDGPGTENVVVASSLVCAGFSSLLTTAAKAGVAAAALVTPKVLQALQGESGLSQVPQVELGAAYLVTSPADLALLQPCSEQVRAGLKPFDPVAGAAAICAFVGGR